MGGLESIEEKKQISTLSPSGMKSIFKAAKLRYPNEFPAVINTPSLKEAINMKCRKTVFKPDS